MPRIRLIVLLLMLGFIPDLASAACSNTTFGNWTCIQSATNHATGAPVSQAYSSNVGAGHLLIAMHSGCSPTAGCGGTTDIPVVSDNINGNWTCGNGMAEQPTPPAQRIGICFFCGSGSGATTVTSTGGYTNNSTLSIEEWSNSGGACFGTPIETPVRGVVTPGGTQLSTTTAFTNDLIYSVFFTTTASVTVGGSWTITTTNVPGTGNIFANAVQNGATATTYTTSWQDTGNVAGASVIMAFRATTNATPCANTAYGNWHCKQTGVSTASDSVSTTGSVGAGSLAVVFYTNCGQVGCGGGPFTTPTMVDNHSNSLTCPAAAQSLFSGDNWGLCFLAGTTSGAFTVTATFNGGGHNQHMWVQEWTNSLGSLSVATFDQGGVIGASGTPCTVCAIATSGPTTKTNELIISGLYNGGYASTDDGVFTYTFGDTATSGNAGTNNLISGITRNGPTATTYTTGWNAFSAGDSTASGQQFQRGSIATFIGPNTSSTPPKSAIIKFKPRRRFPWVIKRNELRIETI